MLLGLMIFGAIAFGLVALYVRFAVDTIDGRDWMERQVR